MHVPYEALEAEIVLDEGRGALILSATAKTIYVRYAFVTLAEGAPILPELVLDDWGHEIRGLGVYRWVSANLLQFPRAEVFGYDANGARAQLFLRELEPMLRLQCYAYARPSEPLKDGKPIVAALTVDEDAPALQRTGIGPDLSWPMRHSEVSWWTMPPRLLANFSFQDIDKTRGRGVPG